MLRRSILQRNTKYLHIYHVLFSVISIWESHPDVNPGFVMSTVLPLVPYHIFGDEGLHHALTRNPEQIYVATSLQQDPLSLSANEQKNPLLFVIILYNEINADFYLIFH